jgi:hypothetical protein
MHDFENLAYDKYLDSFMLLCEDMLRKGLDWNDCMKVLWNMNTMRSFSISSNILRSLTDAMTLDRHLESRHGVLKFIWNVREIHKADDAFVAVIQPHLNRCIVQALSGGSAAYEMVLRDSVDLVCETKLVISQLLQSIVLMMPFPGVIFHREESVPIPFSELSIVLPEDISNRCLNLSYEVFRAVVTVGVHQIGENCENTDFKRDDILIALQSMLRRSSFKLLQDKIGAPLLDMISFLDLEAVSGLCNAGSFDFLLFLMRNTHELLLGHFIACMRVLFKELELSKRATFSSWKVKQALQSTAIEPDEVRLILALSIEACLLWSCQNDVDTTPISDVKQEIAYELMLCLVALSLSIADVDAEMVGVIPRDLPWSHASVSVEQLKECCETMRDSLWNVKHKRSPLDTEYLLQDLYNLRVSEKDALLAGNQSISDLPTSQVESFCDILSTSPFETGAMDPNIGVSELLPMCKSYLHTCCSPCLDCKQCLQRIETFRHSALYNLSNYDRFLLLYGILFDVIEDPSRCTSTCPTALSAMSLYMFDAALYSLDITPERLLLHIFGIIPIASLVELTRNAEPLTRLDSLVAAFSAFLSKFKDLSSKLLKVDMRRVIIEADRIIYNSLCGGAENVNVTFPIRDSVSTMYDQLCELISKGE